MYKKFKKIMQRKRDQRSIKKRTTAFMKKLQKEKSEMKRKFSLDLLLR